MESSVKTFIYLAIIAVIATLNNVEVIQAKSFSKLNNLMKMDELPQEPLQFESIVSRIRRDVYPQGTDGGDIPKEQPHPGSNLRTRRQASADETDMPKGFQKDTDMIREKRQMPSPPGDIPMPPM